MHYSYLLYDVENLLLQTNAAEKAGNIKSVTDKQKRKPDMWQFKILQLYRVGQKIHIFSVHHTEATAKDKLKWFSLKCFQRLLE